MKSTKRRARTRRRSLTVPDCTHFTGYKPCVAGKSCLDECVDPRPHGTRILIVNLEAMGNVLVTTSLLPAIKRKYPHSTISWLTLPGSSLLLKNNPFIDRLYVWDPTTLMFLQAMRFDVIMNVDKSVHAGGLTMLLKSRRKVGYGINENGVIIPLNKEAEYNYRLGLDDHAKFRLNQHPNTKLLTEAMGLEYERDEYVLSLSDEELRFSEAYRRGIIADQKSDTSRSQPVVVGFNTGCSPLYPNKKMTIDQHVILISELSKRKDIRLALLGGPEDTERNAEIFRRVNGRAINTPTTEGLRRGICYINACDVIISGDSFGMHAGIGLKKHIIVWFGVSCPQEIDLFGRGMKLIPESLSCSPCWKKSCPYDLECVQLVDLDKIVDEVDSFAAGRHKGG